MECVDGGFSINDRWKSVLNFLFINHFKLPVDTLPIYGYENRIWLHKKFMSCQWYEVYNLMECFLAGEKELGIQWVDLESQINSVLEREMSAYRAVKSQIIPIAGEREVAEIREASNTRFSGVNEHIDEALRCLGKKPDPDYRGSVRASITGVESACRMITGKTSGGIDDALHTLDVRFQGKLHPALRDGLSKLYAYTSDKEGIRHALLDKSSVVNFAEAKFMLVVCSAFVNLLVDETRK